MRHAVVVLLLGTLASMAGAQGHAARQQALVGIDAARQQALVGIDAARQQALVRFVRQDCGACHGMRLTGGLGPPLTREALAERPPEALAATIVHGRPGTPMPPWRAMLTDDDVRWISEQLLRGFPDEARAAR